MPELRQYIATMSCHVRARLYHRPRFAKQNVAMVRGRISTFGNQMRSNEGSIFVYRRCRHLQNCLKALTRVLLLTVWNA